jgi:two-component system cell cycle response regulator DivK
MEHIKQALVIDDNPKNRQILSRMLEMENCVTVEVPRPTLLERMLDDINALDIVFLDLEMPGLDGYQVLDMFQGHDRFSEVPVVCYTVHVSEMNVAFEHGFHSFIGKPLDADKFPSQLARILKGERVWETP